jgi:hypothetical protein
VVVGLLALLALLAPTLMGRWGQSETFAPLLAMQATVGAQPGVRQAGVKQMSTWNSQQGSQAKKQLIVEVLARGADVDAAALSLRIAQALLTQHEQAGQVDQLIVVVAYGYDIGIASAWRSWHAVHSPDKWRELFNKPSAAQ